MVIFMLLERRDLRDRLIGLFGYGRLTVTTKAFDEAGTRVSRQLLMQSLVNLVYGIAAGIGLYFIGVPYPWVWAALGAALRFIPYLGPVVGAGAPILVSLAALPGWAGPLWVVGLFAVLELFTNLVLETALYAGAAGVSQVALLVSVAFWTWLWGPLGLLLATPLTVCLVVLGKHVPGLEFLATLMADTPALAPEYGYYQRLLARDPSEAADLIERHIKAEAPRSVYDALLLPGAQLRRARPPGAEALVGGRGGGDRCDAGAAVGRDGIDPAAAAGAATTPRWFTTSEPPRTAARARLRNQWRRRRTRAHDARRSRGRPAVVVEVTTGRLLASELVSLVQAQGASIVCLADLPPSPPSKTRYLVKRLRAALPELRILVGRWAPPALADDEGTQGLRDAGATLVASTLAEIRTYLGGLAEIPRVPLPEASAVHVA